jgi:PAS domain S-box-containing protein
MSNLSILRLEFGRKFSPPPSQYGATVLSNVTARPGRLFLPLLAIIVCVSSLPAQPVRFDEAWRWVEFTTESGLPSNRVTGVVETGDGTVWAVTSAGLAWYDDFRWNLVDSSMGLPYQRVDEAMPFGARELLVLTGRKSYIGGRNGFTLLPFDDAPEIVPLPPNALLIKRNSSILKYENGKITPFLSSPGLTSGKTISLWDTRGGAVWANLFSGMYRLEGGEWRLKIPCDPSPGILNLIAENARGTGIAYLTYPFEKRGLWEWSRGSAPVKNSTERLDDVRSLDVGSDDEAIAAYRSGDVKIRRHGVWSLLELLNPDVRDITFVKFRASSDLWIGTEHGLLLYRRSSSRWRFIKHDSPDLRNYTNEILKTRDGSLWVATSDGVETRHPDGRVDYVTRIDSRPLYVVTGLAEDDAGGVWISSGSSFGGAYRWDGSAWTHFGISPNRDDVFIHKIRKDSDGRLWFLGLGENSPGRPSIEPGAFLRTGDTFTPWGEKEGLGNGRVYAFAEGRDGSRWFGTGGGISRWKPKTPFHGVPDVRSGDWTHWNLNSGIRSKRVFTLAIDSTQRLWFGDASTVGTGIGYIDEQDSAHYLTVADGLIDDYIWDLNVDQTGRLWVATADGLCSYANNRWSIFDRQSGLEHSALWPVVPTAGEVYVGTQGGGVAVLNVDASTTPEPRIVLDKPTMEGKNILLRWKAAAYWGELDPPEIMTRYKVQDGAWSPWSRTHEHTLVDLSPGEYTYQVQARGLFGNYLPEGATGSFLVPFPMYLRPGFLLPTGILSLAVIGLGIVLLIRKRNHDLALRKSEERFRTVAEMTSSAIFIYNDSRILFVNSGAENLTGFTRSELLAKNYFDLLQPEERIRLRREEATEPAAPAAPHRYEARIITRDGPERWVDCTSGWIQFEGQPVRLATAFDITKRKIAEGKLRSLASELSMTEERERRRMATYLHDIIGQTLSITKMKIRTLQKSGPPAGQERALADIRDLIEQSIGDTQTLTFELCPPILYELSFEAAIEWLAERMAKQHAIAIEFLDDQQVKPLSEDVKVLLFAAVREILVNVIKHAEAKHAVVGLSREDGVMRVEVSDDGKGFDGVRKTDSAFGGGGFGLFNIRERLTYLGGHLDICSEPGSGTRVTIRAPLQGSAA